MHTKKIIKTIQKEIKRFKESQNYPEEQQIRHEFDIESSELSEDSLDKLENWIIEHFDTIPLFTIQNFEYEVLFDSLFHQNNKLILNYIFFRESE